MGLIARFLARYLASRYGVERRTEVVTRRRILVMILDRALLFLLGVVSVWAMAIPFTLFWGSSETRQGYSICDIPYLAVCFYFVLFGIPSAMLLQLLSKLLLEVWAFLVFRVFRR
jgi:hypothetical protein